jgi:hypothetical protein
LPASSGDPDTDQVPTSADLGFVSVTEMAAHVAAICEVVDLLYANAALQGAVYGSTEVLAGLRERGSLQPVLGRLAPWARRQQLLRRAHHQELEQRYQAN